jgi:hypothetical protein
MEQTVLAKTKMPDDSEGEQFSFVTMDLQAGKMVRMTDALSESEVRSHLKDAGVPEAEINSKIAPARTLFEVRVPFTWASNRESCVFDGSCVY